MAVHCCRGQQRLRACRYLCSFILMGFVFRILQHFFGYAEIRIILSLTSAEQAATVSVKDELKTKLS